MNRLTERYKDNISNIVLIKECGSNCCKDVCKSIDNNCSKCQINKAFEKLADYEDLEEQGLLLRLPISLNADVYTICTKMWCDYDYNCMEDVEYKCKDGEFCEIQKIAYFIRFEKFCVPMIPFINKTVFLTREEAEKKLKELENGLQK